MRLFGTLLLSLFLLLFAASAALGGDRPLPDSDDWAGTYFMGKKLGFNHSRVRVRPEGITVETRMFLRLKAGGSDRATIVSQVTRLQPDLQLIGFSLLQEIMGSRQEIEARVDGEQLVYEVVTRGYRKVHTLDLPRGTVPSASLWLHYLKEGLEVGRKGKFPLLVEPFQRVTPLEYEIVRKETLDVLGKRRETYVIQQDFAGMASTLWMEEDGTVVREVSDQGLESRLENEEMARDLGGETLSAGSFITLSLVKLRQPIATPESLATVKLKLSNLRGPDSIPQDHRQTVLALERNGDHSFAAILRVKREPWALARPARFPLNVETDPSLLQDDSQIQSNHPDIRDLAEELSAGETDPWKVARRINQWVYSNLEKELVDAFTALDALRVKRGECQSHTNLFTAIARAAGIPTRVVNGLVYSSDYKGFVYHAWPEVYVGEWRALEPTFGQDYVDATHIKLSEGNLDGSLKLMEFIGKVEIELVDN